MSINRVFLLGTAYSAPRISMLADGRKVAQLVIETIEPVEQGQRSFRIPDHREWHNIIAVGGWADWIDREVACGTMLYLEGKICRRTVEQGKLKIYIVEIIPSKIEKMG